MVLAAVLVGSCWGVVKGMRKFDVRTSTRTGLELHVGHRFGGSSCYGWHRYTSSRTRTVSFQILEGQSARKPLKEPDARATSSLK
jgi:hypothetical protein